MTLRLSQHVVAFAALSMLLLQTGCSSDSSDPVIIIDPVDPPTTSVKVIHASPDAPAVNILLNNTVAISELQYGASSGFATVDAGDYDITVEGIVPGGNVNVIELTAFTLAEDARNTLLAVNNVATIEALAVAQSASTPTASEVAVAVVHAAPDAPAVDIYVSAVDVDISTLTPVTTLAFTESADAGTLTAEEVQIRAAVGDTVVFDSGAVDLAPFAGANLFIAAIASTTATETAASPIALLVTSDDASVTLRDASTGVGAKVVHAGVDANATANGPVEVFASSTVLGMDPVELIEAFSYTDVFPATNEYAVVPAGSYVFDVAPNTNTIGDSVLTSGALDLMAASELTVVANGRLTSDPAFGLLVTADNNRAIATEARVKVIHAAPAAGTVDVFVTPAGDFSADEVAAGMAGTPLLDDFAPSTITDYVAVAPGDYDVRVVAAGAVAINVEGLALPGGTVATAIARGPAEPSGDPSDFGLILTTN